MDSALDWHGALAALSWQVELGADEAILDAPVNRYELPQKPASAAPQAAALGARPGHAPQPAPKLDPVAEARRIAGAAADIDALGEALGGFEHCALRRGARNAVLGIGHRQARVLILSGAPGREEDRAGRPFAGPAGALLDRMLAAIDLSLEAPDPARGVYLAKLVPWRPPQDRPPQEGELAMLLPFAARLVELVDPEVLVLTGAIACQALLGRGGLRRLRGTWVEALDRPALPMLSPKDLLRRPEAKRDAWADLLTLRARLDGGGAG